MIRQLAILILPIVLSAAAHAGDIRLQDEAGVKRDLVRLRDVAELHGEEARKLAEVVVATFVGEKRELTVTLQGIRTLLETRGDVNWAKVRLRGYASCTVYRLADANRDTEASSVEQPSSGAMVVANPQSPVTLQTPLTLRQRAVTYLQHYAGGEAADLNITFADGDENVLASSAWQQRIEFEPTTRATLGRIPLVVRQYNDADEVVATHRLTAQVTRRMLVVMTTASLSRGQLFTRGDLEVRQIQLADDRVTPVTEISEVIGQVCGRAMRSGSIVTANDLQPAVLVRRGDMVTVRSIQGPLVVRMVGRAMDEGGRDEVIRVRNDNSREVFAARVTGSGQAVAIQHEKDALARSGDER